MMSSPLPRRIALPGRIYAVDLRSGTQMEGSFMSAHQTEIDHYPEPTEFLNSTQPTPREERLLLRRILTTAFPDAASTTAPAIGGVSGASLWRVTYRLAVAGSHRP